MDEFEGFKERFKAHRQNVLQLLEKVEELATRHAEKSNSQLKASLLDEKNRVTATLSDLDKTFNKLQKEVETLNKAKDTLVSDNLLLEYKKKDLLIMTSKLEEANDEILVKNDELLHQQKKITEQAEKLREIHEQILAKNQELEQQKESLLDQSDYLHEANQTITLMHEEVQKQKNEILQKNEELLSLNNEKNNLIGIVAHDLKSPLNQMKGLLTIIKMTSSNLSEETRSCIDMMEHSAERLTNLIAKILDVEAIESKQLNLIIERVNVSELLMSLARRFSMTADEKSIKLHTDVVPEVFILADRVYATQVFENIISNAVKFSPSFKNIFITLRTEKDDAIIEVRDEGPGISDEDKKKLFGKYQKLTAKPTGNETSTGLGLSIVKKFVDSMNGRIWCESTPGNGASFFVTFRQC